MRAARKDEGQRRRQIRIKRDGTCRINDPIRKRLAFSDGMFLVCDQKNIAQSIKGKNKERIKEAGIMPIHGSIHRQSSDNGLKGYLGQELRFFEGTFYKRRAEKPGI